MRVTRQHRHSTADKMLAVHMAGAGASADEIAKAIGRGMTVPQVYNLLTRLGVRMVPKAKNQTCFPIVISQDALEAISDAADRYGMDPRALAGKLLEEITVSPTGLRAAAAEITRAEGVEAVETAQAAE